MTVNATFVGMYEPDNGDPCVGTAPQTASVTVAPGDALVIFGATESSSVTLGLPTGGGLTYTQQIQSTVTTSRDNTYLFTARVPATAVTTQTFTLTMTPVNATSTTRWTFNVERWSSVGGFGATAQNVGSASAPSLTLTTTQPYSAIVFGSSDFLAVDGASRAWNTASAGAITEDDYDRNATFITDYLGHYASPGAAGAKTVGLTAPTGQQWSAVALEVIGLAGTAQAPSPQPADTTSLTDATTVVRTVQSGTADTASLTDSVASSVGHNPSNTLADTTLLTDSVTVVRAQAAGPDHMTMTDSVTVVQTMARTIADTMSVTDTGGTAASALPNTDPNLGRLTTDGSILAVLTRSPITDYQFLMQVNPYMPFGRNQTIAVQNFTMAGSTVRQQDVPGGLQDVMIFGTDRKTPGVWTFDMITNAGADPGQNLSWVDLLGQVWDSPIRQTPNGALPLTYGLAGRLRRVYGRPRRWTPQPEPRAIGQGKVLITADFQLIEDETYYDEAEQSQQVGFTASKVVGTYWQFPIVYPLASITPGALRSAGLTVGGSKATWLTPTITGPVSNPWVQIFSSAFGTQRWSLNGTVPAGTTMTLSGRPWKPGIYDNSDVYHPEMLDPRARLSQLRVPPGLYTLSFGGLDITTQATCTVRWRNAYGGP